MPVIMQKLLANVLKRHTRWVLRDMFTKNMQSTLDDRSADAQTFALRFSDLPSQLQSEILSRCGGGAAKALWLCRELRVEPDAWDDATRGAFRADRLIADAYSDINRALVMAARRGDVDDSRLLIERGAQPGWHRSEALLASVRVGNAELCRLMLEAPTNPAKATARALKLAVSYQHIDVCHVLLHRHYAHPIANVKAVVEQVLHVFPQDIDFLATQESQCILALFSNVYDSS
jgi:hypothetical protein